MDGKDITPNEDPTDVLFQHLNGVFSRSDIREAFYKTRYEIASDFIIKRGETADTGKAFEREQLIDTVCGTERSTKTVKTATGCYFGTPFLGPTKCHLLAAIRGQDHVTNPYPYLLEDNQIVIRLTPADPLTRFLELLNISGEKYFKNEDLTEADWPDLKVKIMSIELHLDLYELYKPKKLANPLTGHTFYFDSHLSLHSLIPRGVKRTVNSFHLQGRPFGIIIFFLNTLQWYDTKRKPQLFRLRFPENLERLTVRRI